jgi:hypothetical protein
MNNSILEKISSYQKLNNVSTTGLYFNFSESFPKAFYETVINYLQRANAHFRNEKPIYDFYIGFDDNKNAYFEFVDRSHRSRVIVIQDNIRYNLEFPPSLIIKENIFLENIKNLDHAHNKNTLASLPNDFIVRFLKDEKDIEPIEVSFDKIAKQIINYISYLEEEAKIAEYNSVEKIYFNESESSKNASHTGGHISKPQLERKHEQIPFEDRKEVLDSYPAEDTLEARATNTSSVYYVKVFKVKEKCKLVMEPIEGNKYTKVVHLDTDKLSKGTIKEIIIDSLQLSRSETTETKEITRHSHTTLEEYKNLLEYLINSKSEGLSAGTISRINEASDTKTR